MMSHYLGFELGLFPNGGYVPLTDDPLQWAWHMALPWTALTILFVGVYARVLQVAFSRPCTPTTCARHARRAYPSVA